MASLLHSLPKKSAPETFSLPAGSSLRLLQRGFHARPEEPRPEAAEAAGESAAPEEPGIELSLRTVLRETAAADLGFPPERVPDHMRVTLPLALVGPQLASGRVLVRMQDLRTGVQESFRPAFAKAAAGLLIAVPLQDIFAALPDAALSALYPAPVRPGRLSRPPGGGVGAAPDESNQESAPPSAAALLAPAPAAPPRPGAAFAPPPAPLFPWPVAAFAGSPEAPAPVLPPSARREEVPAPLPLEQEAAVEAPEAPETADDLGEPFSAGALCEEPPARPGLSTAALMPPPSALETPHFSPVAVAAAAMENSAKTAVLFRERPLPNRILLCALFAPESPLTVSEALCCCGELPGLNGCVLLAAGDFLTGGNPPAEECRALAAEGDGFYQHLAALSRSLGAEKDTGLTLRSGAGWRTFFPEKTAVLAVWHGQPDFSPGVREKLILTLRELAALEEN